MYPKIISFIEGLSTESIDPVRKQALDLLATYIQEKRAAGQNITLHFICTHNSRRSHLAQVWAQVLGAYYKLGPLQSYSGGTEATALFPMVANTLSTHGFKVLSLSTGTNPVYAIGYSQNNFPILGFSKKYDHPYNPESDFAAVMTCDTADQACPFIAGAAKRIPITFEDPKVSDGTPEQEKVYLERSTEIATALKYVFSKIN